jgi:hypothetical protein
MLQPQKKEEIYIKTGLLQPPAPNNNLKQKNGRLTILNVYLYLRFNIHVNVSIVDMSIYIEVIRDF